MEEVSSNLKDLEDNFMLKMKEIELENLKSAEEAEGRDGLIL
jgi:hypothetical protein